MGAAIKGVFQLDDNGKPKFSDRTGRRHYKIVLHMEGIPEDTYAVTYVLHESYYEPVREARGRNSGFAESLTSYGDYTVQAKVRSKCDGVSQVSTMLSVALEAGHRGNRTPAILAAIEDIREH